METNILWGIALVITAVSGQPADYTPYPPPCSYSQIQQCKTSVDNLPVSLSMTSIGIYSMNDDMLKTFCRSFQWLKSNCLACNYHYDNGEVTSLQTAEDVGNYICNKDNSKEYESHSQCLRQRPLQFQLRSCNATFFDGHPDWKTQTRNLCWYAAQFLHCVETSVEETCGVEAANWVNGLDKARVAPLLDNILCPTYQDYHDMGFPHDIADRGRCTHDKVMECVSPLADLNLDEVAIVNMDSDALVDVCRLFTTFSSCMEDARTLCSVVDLLMFEGMVNAYHFLCNETLNEYLEHQSCLATRFLVDQGQSCHRHLKSELSSLTLNMDLTFIMEHVCRTAATYLSCVEGYVTTTCGVTAAQWQRAFDQRLLKPVLNDIQCTTLDFTGWWVARVTSSTTSSTSTTGTTVSAQNQPIAARSSTTVDLSLPIIVGIVFGAIIIITVIIVCMVIYLKRRKRTPVIQQQIIQQPYVIYNNNANTNANIYNDPVDVAGATAPPIPVKSLADLMEKAGIPDDEEANGGVTDAPPKYEYENANPNANENGVALYPMYDNVANDLKKDKSLHDVE